MGRYIVRRILTSIPVILMVAVITFGIMRIAPGDPVMLMITSENIEPDPETIARMEKILGLDKPLPKQFWDWFAGVFTGNMGISYRSGYSVAELLAPRVQPTLSLAILSMLMGVFAGVPLGVLAAWYANRWIDRVVMIFAVLGWSIPAFWLGFNFIWLFAVNLHWFPVIGYTPITEGFIPYLRSIFLPSLTVGVAIMALVARMTRSSMMEVLQEDYIRTARAKGLVERVVMTRHALKPAAIPVVTIIGMVFAGIVTGLVVTETVFSVPGIGRMVVDAVLYRDFPIIQGVMMLVATSYVVFNLVVDVLYAYLDPRIRY